jgi:hypothetical protein
MANFNPVKSGDLITASYFNQILGSFDVRISTLEAASGISGGQMVITGLSPSGPLHMGDQLTVMGQNFGLPSQVVVTIDGARVDGSNFLAGSGNNVLIFQIPAVQGVPPQGRLVTLVVSNPTSAAQFPFTLFPFAVTIPTGQLFVNMTSAPAVGTITAGNSYVFIFTVTADTSLADSYSLAASLDASSKAAGWTAVPVDPTSVNTMNQVPIPQGQNTTTQVGVKVTVPAAAAVGATAQVSLSVTSMLNPVGLNGSGSTSISVGSAPPPPNPIAISAAGASAKDSTGAPLQGASFVGNTISLPHGTASAVVAVNVLCPNKDTYGCVGNGPTFGAGWAGNYPPQAQQFPGNANQTVVVQMNVTTVPAGPASTTMQIQVASKTQSKVTGQFSPTISVG